MARLSTAQQYSMNGPNIMYIFGRKIPDVFLSKSAAIYYSFNILPLFQHGVAVQKFAYISAILKHMKMLQISV